MTYATKNNGEVKSSLAVCTQVVESISARGFLMATEARRVAQIGRGD